MELIKYLDDTVIYAHSHNTQEMKLLKAQMARATVYYDRWKFG